MTRMTRTTRRPLPLRRERRLDGFGFCWGSGRGTSCAAVGAGVVLSGRFSVVELAPS